MLAYCCCCLTMDVLLKNMQTLCRCAAVTGYSVLISMRLCKSALLGARGYTAERNCLGRTPVHTDFPHCQLRSTAVVTLAISMTASAAVCCCPHCCSKLVPPAESCHIMIPTTAAACQIVFTCEKAGAGIDAAGAAAAAATGAAAASRAHFDQ